MSSNGERDLPDQTAVTKILEVKDPLSSIKTSADDNVVDDDDRKGFMDEGNNALEDSNDCDDDMESLIPSVDPSGAAHTNGNGNVNSLGIDDGDDDNTESDAMRQNNDCCCGLIRSTRSVGNMRILFPEYFYSSGWGVLGPHTFGPAVVWLILLAATHGIIKGIHKHDLGFFSVVIAYLFLGFSTYRLTDVSYRDPGICLDREIPGHETPERASQYRFCDRCKVWQVSCVEVTLRATTLILMGP